MAIEDADDFEHFKREYQWNAGYDREDEYEKNPQWAVDASTKEEDDGRTTVYDESNPEDQWITTDTVYDLTNCI